MDKPKIIGGEMVVQEPFPAWPQSNELEANNLEKVLSSGQWWKASGTQVKQFENDFSAFHNAPFGLALTNGTHAIELALRCLDIGSGDEVIIPSLTFIATATPVLKLGAIPVPIDVCSDDWCMDPMALEQAITDRTKAIMPVHFAGQIARMQEICEIAAKFSIPIIEDAAHAHGAEMNNQKAGSCGAMAAFSFQNYKLMTAGEGGFLMFNDQQLYEKGKLITNCGRPENDKDYQHILLGDNFRMSEFQAAVLNGQLTRLEEQGKNREANAKVILEELDRIPGIHAQNRMAGTNRHSYYMIVFTYEPAAFHGLSRAHFVEALVAEGVPAYRMYPLVQDAPFFRKALQQRSNELTIPACPVGENLAASGVWIHHRVLLGSRANANQLVQAIAKIYQHSAELAALHTNSAALIPG